MQCKLLFKSREVDVYSMKWNIKRPIYNHLHSFSMAQVKYKRVYTILPRVLYFINERQTYEILAKP